MNKAILGLLVLLLVGEGILFVRTPARPAAPRFDTPYQAVLLDGGEVYYGRLAGLGTPFPVLTDVYYVKTAVDPQTKVATNVLVRRGKEWHAPDRMVINARHIILVEPVGTSSKVAQLIEEDKKQEKGSH